MLAAGRWHNKGQLIVYCAPNPATALLEVLVHSGELEPDELPATYQFLKIEVPEDVSSQMIAGEDLPTEWRQKIKITRQLGDQWLVENHSALLHVPSVIVPETFNCLLNPRHPASSRLRIVDIIDYPLDKRLR